MDKENLLKEIKSAIETGLISTSDLEAVSFQTRGSLTSNEDNTVVKKLGLSEVFYFIGGLVVLIGLIILVAQNWQSFPLALKVLITLGMGIGFYVSAFLLSKTENLNKLGVIFYFLSAVLIPFGYFVLFADQVNASNATFFDILVPALCLLQFGITQMVTRKNIFTLFNVVFCTWLFFAITNPMINASFGETFQLYRAFFVGITYLFIGYFLKMSGRMFSGYLNFFGTVAVLGSGFILNVMASPAGNACIGCVGAPQASAIWTLLYPILVVATIILGVTKIKSSSFLFVGTIAMIAYIIRITGQYFTDTIGWPIALIFLGIVIMGLGYLAFYLNQKYIKSVK
ncbi:MAG: DUF2157 domain-containing protein [bacterium]